MPLELSRLASELVPEQTVLFFGAGASVPSHAPSVARLMQHFEDVFQVPKEGYTLREYAGILEDMFTRRRLITELRSCFDKLKPTGSLLNLPLYSWKSIFSTNYDTLVEQCYEKKGVELSVCDSNFDFTAATRSGEVKLFKLHGTIQKDVADGHQSRIILTDADYDHTQAYREALYDRLRADFYGAELLIIGHSLADEDVKSIANRAAEITTKSLGVGRVTLLMYERDVNRAALWEKRGFRVCFGSIDDFFSAIATKLPYSTSYYRSPEQPLDHAPALRPVTIDVAHEVAAIADVSRMFNGWAATYGDIQSGLTFKRTCVDEIEEYLDADNTICATLLGASGLGKTTAARQAVLRAKEKGYVCWEHKGDFDLAPREWLSVARSLSSFNAKGLLFIDDAHAHLFELNELLDALHSARLYDLKLILTSTRNHWNPRVKSASFYKVSREIPLRKLKPEEIDGLLNLVDSNPQVRLLVEESFSGFSRYEKRRRLIDRCESETFVCLKNIFSSEKFDDIILREYASLAPEHQEIYRIVAAMESSGIRVHRQLVIRLLGIPAESVRAALSYLTDIIHEYVINEREGLYGWKGRHSVIVGILTKYKYPETSALVELFERVIDAISPTYEVEIRTIRELCNIETGLPRIPDRSIQNRLLRKMMSIAPGERVPRHRLIRNLIDIGDFEKAEAEIRIFEKDFGRDAPVTRYRINILTGRALNSPGILEEDRLVILNQARDLAATAAVKYPDNKTILSAYCEVGVEIYRKTGDFAAYDAAMAGLKAAEARIEDPDISKIVRKYERLMAGHSGDERELVEDDFGEER